MDPRHEKGKGVLPIDFDFDYPGSLEEPVIDQLPDGGAIVDDMLQRELLVDYAAFTPQSYIGHDVAAGECPETKIRSTLQLLGEGRTRDGLWELSLSDVKCSVHEDGARRWGTPAILATPVMGRPVLTSMGYSRSADRRSLVLRVFTTTPDGDPVDWWFHWRANIPFGQWSDSSS